MGKSSEQQCIAIWHLKAWQGGHQGINCGTNSTADAASVGALRGDIAAMSTSTDDAPRVSVPAVDASCILKCTTYLAGHMLARSHRQTCVGLGAHEKQLAKIGDRLP